LERQAAAWWTCGGAAKKDAAAGTDEAGEKFEIRTLSRFQTFGKGILAGKTVRKLEKGAKPLSYP
jgi:hypothetical protein